MCPSLSPIRSRSRWCWTRGGVQAARLHLLDLPLYTWLSSSSRLQLPLASGLRTPALNP
jgi:hypothetical protein